MLERCHVNCLGLGFGFGVERGFGLVLGFIMGFDFGFGFGRGREVDDEFEADEKLGLLQGSLCFGAFISFRVAIRVSLSFLVVGRRLV